MNLSGLHCLPEPWKVVHLHEIMKCFFLFALPSLGKDIGSLICNVGSGVAAAGAGAAAGGGEAAGGEEKAEEKKEEKKEESEEESDDDMGFGGCGIVCLLTLLISCLICFLRSL